MADANRTNSRKNPHRPKGQAPEPTGIGRWHIAKPSRSRAAQRAARKAVKQALDEHARRAFSDVFNDVFPLHAAAAPHGSARPFYRWYLEAMRRELEVREAAPV